MQSSTIRHILAQNLLFRQNHTICLFLFFCVCAQFDRACQCCVQYTSDGHWMYCGRSVGALPQTQSRVILLSWRPSRCTRRITLETVFGKSVGKNRLPPKHSNTRKLCIWDMNHLCVVGKVRNESCCSRIHTPTCAYTLRFTKSALLF